ncbi:TetR/AcrR family transcriptional regulator [Sphingomonas sp.]|uniref:TetR/AcrR family transcriptional regulator n=1 Tax=Sphingomonas sp. TaxID=28214 RepID=UPI001E076F78|nr:TetR family transcriptional regulator [Sphingomonas sp.]MBX9796467.1 TetR family transcriptional regulator [Sphingomonas sp.]
MTGDRRQHLLEQLADHMLAHGLGGTSLRPVAAALGTSDRMLLYYFTTKAELIAATLQTVAQRLELRLNALAGAAPRPAGQLARELPQLMMGEELWPYMRLWLEIAARAAAGDATCRAVGEAIAGGFLDWVGARIETTDDKRAQQAALLAQLIDGALLFHAVGMSDLLAQAQGQPAR